MTFKQRWSIILSLTIANFLWQVIYGQNWALAAERSWLQAVAVLITSWTCWNEANRMFATILVSRLDIIAPGYESESDE